MQPVAARSLQLALSAAAAFGALRLERRASLRLAAWLLMRGDQGLRIGGGMAGVGFCQASGAGRDGVTVCKAEKEAPHDGSHSFDPLSVVGPRRRAGGHKGDGSWPAQVRAVIASGGGPTRNGITHAPTVRFHDDRVLTGARRLFPQHVFNVLYPVCRLPPLHAWLFRGRKIRTSCELSLFIFASHYCI